MKQDPEPLLKRWNRGYKTLDPEILKKIRRRGAKVSAAEKAREAWEVKPEEKSRIL